jgi:hypothetical protein
VGDQIPGTSCLHSGACYWWVLNVELAECHRFGTKNFEVAVRFFVDGSDSGSCKIAEFAVSGTVSSYPIDNVCFLRWVSFKEEQFIACALSTSDVLALCGCPTAFDH